MNLKPVFLQREAEDQVFSLLNVLSLPIKPN